MTNNITHFWDIIKPSNPPMVYVKTESGKTFSCFMQSSDDHTPLMPCEEPQPFTGYAPVTHEYGYKFGSWRPISEWNL